MSPHSKAGPETRAGETLAGWHLTLEEIARLGDLMCAAIERDDLITAIATMMQLRRARTDIARVEARESNLDHVTPEELAIVRASMERTRVVEAVMQQWLARPLPGDAALLSSAMGVAVLADTLLPAAWDFERDAVVLIGDELAPVAQVLVDLGQSRLVFLGNCTVPGVVTVCSPDEVSLAIRTMTPMAPTQVALRASTSADVDVVEACTNVCRDSIGDLRVHQNTIVSFSRLWIQQGAENLGALARYPTVDAVGDAFAGKPMVIVAPGPSLAKNIDQLREVAGRAIVCCFSHSLKPVLAAGITPDIIVSVDPQDVRYHFAGCDTTRSYLVNGATVHPSLFTTPSRGVLTLAANGPIDDWLFQAIGESTPEVVGGGSVATSAFSLALRWKCDPVIFLGLDLSFPEGKYYVATSSDGDARAEVSADGTMRVAGWSAGFREMKARGGPAAIRERVVELPGWSGDRVPSSFMFALFHRWFVETMRRVTTRVYNCTEGGARIEGMQHVPFADVRALLDTPVDMSPIAAAIAETDTSSRARSVERRLRTITTHLRRARQLANRARDLIASGAPERELRRVERVLGEVLQPIGFVSLLAQREVDCAVAVAVHAGDAAVYLAGSDALFVSLIGAIDQLAPILDAARTGAPR
ncbi:MAG: motility associated factor glycosyltransferase family protein [Kofleriaceae bacterium]